MSYAIFTICFGYPLYKNNGEPSEKDQEIIQDIHDGLDSGELERGEFRFSSGSSPYSRSDGDGKISKCVYSVPGFLSEYCSSGGDPLAFGVVLGQFDEACHHIELSDLSVFEIDPVQKQLVNSVYTKLPDDIKQYVKKNGPPRLFMLRSSS